MDDALLQTFRGTDYMVCLDDAEWACLRIGQIPPAPLLQRIGLQSWAFITAWNPAAMKRVATTNMAVQRELLHTLRQWPEVEVNPAIGIGPHWYEPSLFVIGPDTAYLDPLARRHRQLAYVHGSGSDVATLRLL